MAPNTRRVTFYLAAAVFCSLADYHIITRLSHPEQSRTVVAALDWVMQALNGENLVRFAVPCLGLLAFLVLTKSFSWERMGWGAGMAMLSVAVYPGIFTPSSAVNQVWGEVAAANVCLALAICSASGQLRSGVRSIE